MAARVPIPDGSIVDLTVKLNKKPSRDEINEALRSAAHGNLEGVLEYSTVPVVSSDIIGNPHSSIFDSLLTQARADGYARVMSWYDNEWGYSNRCVDLILKMHEIDNA
jgi:glyceraldehyde 3-phosphate dehydrogenase